MRNLLSLAALTALCSAASAVAAPVFQAGPYIGVDAARASVSSHYVDSDNDISLGFTAGYQATPNVAVEVVARSLSFNPFRGLLAPAGYYPEQHYGIAVLGSAPLTDNFSFFGRIGVGSTHMQATRSNLPGRNETDPVYGIGGRYSFSNNWSISAEATRLNKSEVTLIAAGLRYQF